MDSFLKSRHSVADILYDLPLVLSLLCNIGELTSIPWQPVNQDHFYDRAWIRVGHETVRFAIFAKIYGELSFLSRV